MTGSRAPHSPQNFCPCGFSCWHWLHCISGFWSVLQSRTTDVPAPFLTPRDRCGRIDRLDDDRFADSGRRPPEDLWHHPRARRRGPRPARGRSRGPAPPPAARAPARRAVLEPRPARAQMARPVSPNVHRGGRRPPHGDARVRARARDRGSPRHPRRRAPHPRCTARRAERRRDPSPLRAPHGRGVVSFARRCCAIVWKDVLVERRSKETVNAVLFFSVLLLFVFEFTLGADRERLVAVLPGLLWLGILLAALLGLGRSFVLERDNDCWEALLLTPGDKGAIYLGKLVGNVLLLALVEAVVLTLFTLFLNVDVARALPALVLVLALGTLGIAAVATLFGAMTAHARARELLFPVLLLPVLVPVLLAIVKSTEALLLGEPLGSVAHWMKLLAAADVIYVVVGLLPFDAVLEG